MAREAQPQWLKDARWARWTAGSATWRCRPRPPRVPPGLRHVGGASGNLRPRRSRRSATTAPEACVVRWSVHGDLPSGRCLKGSVLSFDHTPRDSRPQAVFLAPRQPRRSRPTVPSATRKQVEEVARTHHRYVRVQHHSPGRLPPRRLWRRRHGLTVVASGVYVGAMKTPGVRELENRLSTDLRRVENGERVAIAHRGRIVAEPRPPTHTTEEGAHAELGRPESTRGLSTLAMPGTLRDRARAAGRRPRPTVNAGRTRSSSQTPRRASPGGRPGTAVPASPSECSATCERLPAVGRPG